jgi:hypothetical protein
MKRWLLILTLGVCGVSIAQAEGGDSPSGGRYQMFNNPHANRMYVLDTQTGRMFQLATYKDIGKEILEEIPYVYTSLRLCTPAEYERGPDRCFSRNYDYMKNLISIQREQSAPPAAPAKEK